MVNPIEDAKDSLARAMNKSTKAEIRQELKFALSYLNCADTKPNSAAAVAALIAVVEKKGRISPVVIRDKIMLILNKL